MGEAQPDPAVEIRPASENGPVVEIRPADLADLDELVDVYLSAAAHHVAIDPAVYLVPTAADAAIRWRKRVESRGPDVECIVSVVDGRVVGSASIEMIPSNGIGSMIRPLRMAELGIGILDGYRGLGLGQRLIAELERWAAEHGVERIVLLVADSNEGALRLYRRLGYVDESLVLRKDVADVAAPDVAAPDLAAR
jgi:RimJ/RimL family protein N-acetyltransferase